eukprot:COSAG02_NODE_3617_length_6471_cov_4.987759_1_plen_111_part_00
MPVRLRPSRIALILAYELMLFWPHWSYFRYLTACVWSIPCIFETIQIAQSKDQCKRVNSDLLGAPVGIRLGIGVLVVQPACPPSAGSLAGCSAATNNPADSIIAYEPGRR